MTPIGCRASRAIGIPCFALSGEARHQSKLAVLSTATALVGVVVGGLIGFLSNRTLQDHESDTAARGAARVYQARLLQAADDVSRMLETGHAFDPRRTLPPDLDVDDKRLMASELAADEWAEVLRSASSVSRMLTSKPLTAVPDPGGRISRPTCEFLHEQLRELTRGVDVLADLSGFDLSSSRREVYTTRAC
jgi:hypothetical protein